MGPAGDCMWGDIHGLCIPGLGPGRGVADGGATPGVGGTLLLGAVDEVPGTHPVGEVRGGQLGGIEVPGCL